MNESTSNRKQRSRRAALVRDRRGWTCLALIIVLVSFGAVLLVVSSWIMSVRRDVNNFKHLLSTYEQRLQTDENKLYHLADAVATQYNLTRNVYNETAHDLANVNQVVKTQSSLMAYQFAGIFALLASLISIWHISNHLRHYDAPAVQRKIIAILWMVPVYSVTSWLTLVTAYEYFAIFKDFYEALIIYNFLSFLIAVIGRGNRKVVIQKLTQDHSHLKPPISFPCQRNRQQRLQYYETNHQAKAEAVLYQCQFFTMQFVFLRPITSVGMAISNAVFGTAWDATYPQFYILILENISVATAFTGLLRFYHAVHTELEWCRPFPKFLCIKGIVFMTFWQGFLITLVAKAGFSSTDGHNDAAEWSLQAQNFLICLEMLFFAITHGFIFPYEEWQRGYNPRDKPGLFQESNALDDLFKDIKFLIHNRKEHKAEKKKYLKQHKEKDDTNGSSNLKLGESNSDDIQDNAKALKHSSSSRLETTKKRRKGKYYVVYKACDIEEGDEITVTDQDEIVELGTESGSFDDSLTLVRSISGEGKFQIDDHNDTDVDDLDQKIKLPKVV